MVELFIIGHLFIGQTGKAVSTIPTNNERPGNVAIIPIKTVWRQTKVLRGIIADNASVIPPRVACVKSFAYKFLSRFICIGDYAFLRALYFLRTDIIERMVFRKLPKLKIAPSRSTQLYVDRFILS